MGWKKSISRPLKMPLLKSYSSKTVDYFLKKNVCNCVINPQTHVSKHFVLGFFFKKWAAITLADFAELWKISKWRVAKSVFAETNGWIFTRLAVQARDQCSKSYLEAFCPTKPETYFDFHFSGLSWACTKRKDALCHNFWTKAPKIKPQRHNVLKTHI